jgi:hypothetical protein
LRLVYPKLIEGSFPVDAGRMLAPAGPGLGIRWLPEIFNLAAPNYRQSTLN